VRYLCHKILNVTHNNFIMFVILIVPGSHTDDDRRQVALFVVMIQIDLTYLNVNTEGQIYWKLFFEGRG